MDLPEYLDQTADLVDKFIHRNFGSATGDLGKATAHLLIAGGKRLRPAVTLLAADAVRKGAAIELLPAAVALELTHTFTLIHDDIMDDDMLRRGVQTVHTKWDMPTAILAGDVLFASAFEHLCLAKASPDAKIRAINLLAKTCVEICEGQHLDMSFEGRDDVSRGEYLEMVRKKTGVLYGSAAAFGAILAEGTTIQMDALYQYGIHTGMAFQIQDDLIDIMADSGKSGKDRGSDIREGKQTLISIIAQEKGIDLSKYRGVTSDAGIEEVIGRLESAGVVDEVRTTAQDLVGEGCRRIKVLNPSPEHDLLVQIGEFFITRGA